MLDDDLGDRTLPPTERHRRAARERGEVARSSLFTSAVILFSASCLFWLSSPTSANPLAALMRAGLSAAPANSMTVDSAINSIHVGVQVIVLTLLPVVLVLVVSGLAANMTQVGLLWVPAAAVPRFRTGGLFSRDSFAESIGWLLRFGLLGFVTWRFLLSHDWQLRSVARGEPVSLLVQLFHLIAELTFQLSICLLLLAVVDYGYRFWRHEQRLKMTFEERRREQREDTIDPRVKQQRAALGRQSGPAMPLSEIERVGSAVE